MGNYTHIFHKNNSQKQEEVELAKNEVNLTYLFL